MTDLGWAALRSAALVGTARRPVPAAAPQVRSRDQATAEIQLLDRAALIATALRAARPAVRQAPLVVAAADEAQAPTPLQTQLLTLAVHQPPAGARLRSALLVHWCERAARAHVHAPAALLPGLLDLATTDRGLRPAVRPVLDRRGEWLAAQNPLWSWALPAQAAEGPGPSPTGWAHLPSADRPARLAAMRAEDPTTARELLAGTWDTESAKDRCALLGALAVGLSHADEELLEHALDDPSRGVREQAARLLTRLPGSARAARMRARLAPLVTRRGLVHKELVVDLPGEPDEAAVRDGLGRAPAGHSQRGSWLRELIIGTPLSFWTDLAQADARTVVVRIQKHQEAVRALVEAAAIQRDPVWAVALAEQAEGRALSRLIELLPGQDVECRATALLDRSDADRLKRYLAAMTSFSPDLSRRLVAGMSQPKLSPRLVLQDQDLLARLHPSCIPELIALSRRADLAPAEQRTVTELVQLLSVRQSISEAFT